jgi:hypothetical protein
MMNDLDWLALQLAFDSPIMRHALYMVVQ